MEYKDKILEAHKINKEYKDSLTYVSFLKY